MAQPDIITSTLETCVRQSSTSELPSIAQTLIANVQSEPPKLWDAAILRAKQSSAPQLDTLAELVKLVKAQPAPWSELPSLGLSMREAWNTAPPQSTPEEWSNLNGFAARLTANESSDFSLFALWSLRDALEVPRQLTERQTGAGDSQSSQETSVDELLPAAIEWLEICGSQMVACTIQSRVYAQEGQSPDPGWLGKLAKDTGIAKGGFSVRRWQFWRRKLQEISEARDNAGGREKIAKVAYQGLLAMEKVDAEVRVMAEDMDRLHG